MNIFFKTLWSNLSNNINSHFTRPFTPLQKKVVAIAFIFFGCMSLSYAFFHYFRAQRKENDQDDNKIDNYPISSEPSPTKTPLKVIIKAPQEIFTQVQEFTINIHSPSLAFSPETLPELKQEANLMIPTPDGWEDLLQPTIIDDFIHQATLKKDFLSILRYLVDHPEWVEDNMKRVTTLLQAFGGKASFLQPIKVVADLYEGLLAQHPSLALNDTLKNTDVIFEDKSTYRTHLIFALKNLHVVRDKLEEEMPDFFDSTTKQIEIHLPGIPKDLKAVLQYLDKSDLTAIEKTNFLELIKIADQYNIPSLWRYCETSLENKISKFSNDSIGEQAWLTTLLLYANVTTHRIHFIIDYLLLQREENFTDYKEYRAFLETISLDNFSFIPVQDQNDIRDKILSRFDIAIVNKAQMVREEHEDRILDSVAIIEGLVKKLSSNDHSSFESYMSCSSVNTALRTLFKAAIAQQLDHHAELKKRIIYALQAIQDNEKEIILETTWRAFEWDSSEAEGIPSLVICLLHYLLQEIPEEITSKPFWHGASLVLAFNDNQDNKRKLSDAVIDFAERAVGTVGYLPGFYFLLRPSSRLASKNSVIFTMTYNAKATAGKNHIMHARIRATQNPTDQTWLFNKMNAHDKDLPLDDFLKTMAGDLPIYPLPKPETQKQRITFYHVI